METYSDKTGEEYASWEDYVRAETEGYIVTAVLQDRSKIWTWSHGPYPEKRLAINARAKMRRKFDKNNSTGASIIAMSVRPLWKAEDL